MYPHLHTVGFVVQDMGKALAFYRLLGLDIPKDQDGETHVEFSASNGYAIGFVAEAMVRQTDPKWTDGFGNRLNLQFEFGSPAEVDGTFSRLESAGYEVYQAPWDAFWGQRFARVVDADRNVVNIYADLPK